MSNLCFSQKLIDVTSKIGSGATPTGGENSYKKNGITFIRSQNVLDMSFSENNLAYIDEKQAEKLNNVAVAANDILLNITGDSIARCCIVPDSKLPARVNQHVAIVRPKNIEPYYLCYYLQFMKPYLLRICGIGGTRNALTKEIIGKIPLIRNRNESKIAHVLSSIDKMIGLNNKINAELEAMAKTIYDYWFLQFEFPNEEGKPYKSSGGKLVYNEELKREIPEGWTVKPLSEFGLLTMGQSPQSSSYNENVVGLPLINGAAELQKDKIEILKYTTKPTRTCEKDDLIFCIRATIGNLTYADKAYCLGRGVAGFKPGHKSNYGYMFFVIKNLLEIYNKILSGSVIVGISKEDLLERRVLKPPASLLENFSNKINPVIKKRKSIRKENQELIALRDFLLPLLMNGQVSFKE